MWKSLPWFRPPSHHTGASGRGSQTAVSGADGPAERQTLKWKAIRSKVRYPPCLQDKRLSTPGIPYVFLRPIFMYPRPLYVSSFAKPAQRRCLQPYHLAVVFVSKKRCKLLPVMHPIETDLLQQSEKLCGLPLASL
jgi:hypothetical protein